MTLSLAGLGFSLLAGLVFGVFYTLNKKAAGTGDPYRAIFWVFAFHLPLILVWVLATPDLRMTSAYALPGLAAMLLTLTGNLLTLRAVALAPFSLIIPILGLSPVFTALLGIPLLGETPSMQQACGIGLTVLGVAWLYAPPERPLAVLAFLPRLLHGPAAPLVILASLNWALVAPFSKLAIREASLSLHTLVVIGGATALLYLIVLGRSRRRKGHAPSECPRRSLTAREALLFFLAAAAGVLGIALELLALQNAPAGLFEALKRVACQLVALGVGWACFREPITPPKLIGLALLALGLPLIVV